MRRTLPLLLALPCLASTAAAQFEPGEQIQIGSFVTNWSSMTRLVAGDFSGQGYLDAVQRRSNFGLHLYGPPVHNHIIETLTDVIALSTVPGGGDGGRDAVIIGGSTGLRRAMLDPNATPPYSAWMDTAFATGTAYQNPTRIHVADMDGVGTQDLLMLSEDGLTIYIFSDIGAATLPSSPTKTITVPSGPAFDIVPLDWTGGSNREIGYVRLGFTGVMDQNGNTPSTPNITSIGRGNVNSRLAFADASGGNSRLISTHRATVQGNLTDLLHVMNPDTATGFTPMGNIDAVAVVNGDLDGDDVDDLVFSYQSDYQLTVLYSGTDRDYLNEANDVEHISLIPGTNVAIDNVAWPCIGDFDNDTDNDILFAIQQQSEIHFIENNRQKNVINYRPQVDWSGWICNWDVPTSTGHWTDGATLTLEFDPPAVTLPGHDKMQLVVWRRETETALTINNEAVFNETWDLQTGTTQLFFDYEDLNYMDGTTWELVVRTIKEGTSSEPLEASAAWVGSYVTTNQAATNVSNELGVMDWDHWVPDNLPGGGTGVTATGVFVRIKLPGYQSPAVPTVPALISNP